MSNAPTSTLRIYAAGGFGINIAKKFEPDTKKSIPGMAAPAIAYIDTSESNLRGIENRDDVFLIDGTDGAGKIRGLHIDEILPLINPILNQFKPGDFNVVVFSGSGGSGSVIGALIAGALLARGLPVVALVVGSSESAKATENTINTIKTLEGQVDIANAPLVFAYEHNEPGRKRSEVDEIFYRIISSLAVLTSRQNDELDSTDILHVFRFDKSTNVGPRLATFGVYRSNEELDPDAELISMASLYADPDAPTATIKPDYHAAGYLPRDVVEGSQVFHFPVRIDEVRGIMAFLEKQHATYKGDSENRVLAKRVLNAGEADKKTGLVL